jgi:excisionase family DNA binding protein
MKRRRYVLMRDCQFWAHDRQFVDHPSNASLFSKKSHCLQAQRALKEEGLDVTAARVEFQDEEPAPVAAEPKPKPRPLAAVYAQEMTEEQSVASLERLKALAAERGYTLVAAEYDVGWPGDVRLGQRALMTRARRKEYDILLVQRLDRLRGSSRPEVCERMKLWLERPDLVIEAADTRERVPYEGDPAERVKITVRQAAQALETHDGIISKLIADGTLETVRKGKQVYVYADQVEEFERRGGIESSPYAPTITVIGKLSPKKVREISGLIFKMTFNQFLTECRQWDRCPEFQKAAGGVDDHPPGRLVAAVRYTEALGDL